MSLSHLASRERLPQPSRGCTLRRLSRSSRGRSRSRRRPSHCHALAPSIYLSLPIFLLPPSLNSFSFSLFIRLAAASVSAPRAAPALEVTRSSCFPLARSRARSSPSFQLFDFVLCPAPVYPPCIRLSSPPSSYNLLLSRAAAIIPRPKRRHTYVRAPSLPVPYNSPPSYPAVFYADPRHRIPLYNAVRRSLEKSRNIRRFEFIAFAENTPRR